MGKRDSELTEYQKELKLWNETHPDEILLDYSPDYDRIERLREEEEREKEEKLAKRAAELVTSQMGLSRTEAAPLVPPAIARVPWRRVEQGILKALHYRGLTLGELAGRDEEGQARVPKANGEPYSFEMIRDALLTTARLRLVKVVDFERGVGYYRPDALPGLMPA